MRDKETPAPTGTGLSTDDIARSSERETRDTDREADTGRDTGRDTGLGADRETDFGSERGTDREGGTEVGREQEAGTDTTTPIYPGQAFEVGSTDRDTDTPAAPPADADRDTGVGGAGARGAGAGDTGAGGAGTGGIGTRGVTETGGAGAGADGGGERRSADDEAPRLMDPGDEESFRTRWHELQSLFVDDPRQAVHEADALVADVMQRLAATFADHRKSLEGQWRQGEDVDTESLRMALRRYRSFFHRLLSTGLDSAPAESGGRAPSNE
ncbi:hypothetical protein [Streptomyces sp. NPDC053431]|uniref:hypothetical protein n=1 Tax=Streptomyces sp. NPDC053431 TaxID=3365703 RepID=UPI0037D3E394